MAKTRRREPRNFYSREATWAKRQTMRRWKAACRRAAREGRFDDMPLKLGTQGWLTW